MEIIQQLTGRLHPLVVHLPIGFILLGLLLQWYDRKSRQFTRVIGLIYLWAGISATVACITGYLQYIGEGYGFDTVKWHLWSGIATALFCFVMCAKIRFFAVQSDEVKMEDSNVEKPSISEKAKSHRENKELEQSTVKIPSGVKPFFFLKNIPITALSILFFLLISFTGHQGGNITHGEDYLVEPLPNSIKSALGYETLQEKKIALNESNWENALLYEDVISPILNNKCVSCHNPKKTKGGLLLHSKEGILAGGETGEVVVANNASESEILVRMNLPKSDDDHMPPDGKSQPSKEEIRLIEAWLDAGHPFAGTIATNGLEKELFYPFFPKKVDNDYPNLEITAASQDSIDAIKEKGIHVDRISESTHFLKVSCLNKASFSDSDFSLLHPLRNQIAVLDLGGTQISDAIFDQLATLPHLTILNVDHTNITGKGIEQLASGSEHLKSINLTDTEFQEPYLGQLANFKKLQRVFVFNTPLNQKGSKSLKAGQVTVDYGNYELPPIASDSIVY